MMNYVFNVIWNLNKNYTIICQCLGVTRVIQTKRVYTGVKENGMSEIDRDITN